jgi:hypothetical protein
MNDIGEYFEEDTFDPICEQKWWDSQNISYEDWVNSWNNLNKKI